MMKSQGCPNNYMSIALKQAQKAMLHNEVPIGAVIIDPNGHVLARGHNMVEKRNTQTAHAEMIAIDKACKKLGDWRLNGCSLYVTLEPCSMCMGLIRLSRLEHVIYGASSPLFGFELDKQGGYQVYKKDMPHIQKGLCAEESIALLKKFFKEKRK